MMMSVGNKLTRLRYENYQALLEQLLKLLRARLGDRLTTVVLYGSVARGTATLQSDVDLLVIVCDAPSNYFARLDPLLEAWRVLEKSQTVAALYQQGIRPYLSFLVLSEEEANQNRYIFLDMIEEGIILHDRDGYFARRLEALKERLIALGSRRVCLEDGTWYWDLKPDLVLGEVFEL
ncbi:MAG TPA: nucleotidyltransferase domain-containing protein [Anaerolineae bacterium]|nr:nucleotidyltransferase domain-containing protein [Anaerolineae bacterium]